MLFKRSLLQGLREEWRRKERSRHPRLGGRSKDRSQMATNDKRRRNDRWRGKIRGDWVGLKEVGDASPGAFGSNDSILDYNIDDRDLVQC